MLKDEKDLPRAGIITLSFPGYFLGEELASKKYEEALSHLEKLDLALCPVKDVVTDVSAAEKAGRELSAQGVNFICAFLATFVPDHFIVALLDSCDVPLFLYAIEREIACISLVGAMLANPTLYELDKQYNIVAGDIGNSNLMNQLGVFARAACMKRTLSRMCVGYMGKNPDIMFSMQADEYGLKKQLGVTVVPLRDFEYTRRTESVPDEEAASDWETVKGQVGRVDVSDIDGIEASKGYIAMHKMADEMDLDALSINCWTQLKSKICLPVARFNDMGIGAGCEGDLHSTILMRLLYGVTGRAALNGDFMRLYPDENHIMFSHCGAGSFSMARSKSDIVLHESIETRDGIGVFFPADQPGRATAINLMGSREGYRLSVLVGDVQKTDMSYEGNPMRIAFDRPVHNILQAAVKHGAGHHWSISYGDLSDEFELLTQFLHIDFHLLSSE